MSTTLTFSSSIASAPTGGSSYLWESSKDGSNWTTLSSTTDTLNTSALTGEFIRVTVDSAAPLLGFMSTGGGVVLGASTGDSDNVLDFTSSSSLALDPADYHAARLPIAPGESYSVEVLEDAGSGARALKVIAASSTYTINQQADGSFVATDGTESITLIGIDVVAVQTDSFNLHVDVWSPQSTGPVVVDGTPWHDVFLVDLDKSGLALANAWIDAGSGVRELQSDGGVTLVRITPAPTSAIEPYDYLLEVMAEAREDSQAQSFQLTDVERIELSLSGTPQQGLGLPVLSVTQVVGTSASETLLGTAHDDVIDGRGGNDTLTGNGGHDVFVYDTADGGPDALGYPSTSTYTQLDVITDFSVNDDSIRLQANGVALTLDNATVNFGVISDQSYRVEVGTLNDDQSFTRAGSGPDALVLYDGDDTVGTVVASAIAVVGVAPGDLLAAINPAMPAPTVSIDGYAVNSGSSTPLSGAPVALDEGDALAVTLKRSGDLSQASQVSWALDISASGAADASDFSQAISGVASFAVGAGVATVNIAVDDDTTDEGQEGFVFILGAKSADDVNVSFPVDQNTSDDVPAFGMALAASISASDATTTPSAPLDIMAGDSDADGLPELRGIVTSDALVTITAPDGTTTFTATADVDGHFSVELDPLPASGMYTVSEVAGSAEVWLGTVGNDSLTGTSGADLIFAGQGDDDVVAGAGDDDIVFSQGSDTVDGGLDVDTLILPTTPMTMPQIRDVVDEVGVVHLQTAQRGQGFTDAYTVTMTTGTYSVQVQEVNGGHIADLLNVERIEIGDLDLALAPVEVTDEYGDKFWRGTRGDDQFVFTAADTFSALAHVDGREGRDTVSITFSTGTLSKTEYGYELTADGASYGETVSVYAMGGAISMSSMGEFRSIEALTLADTHGNTFNIDASALTRGFNAIDVDDDADILDDDSPDEAWLSDARALDANGFRVLDGKGGSDRLVGTDIDDVNEKDHLMGGQGDDSLEGRGGFNLLDGGEGRDEASYEMAERGVKVDIFRTDEQDTGVSHDTILNIENLFGSAYADNLGGSGWSNVMDGNAGHDELFGGRGHDTLLGGDGHDFLDGGIGNDTLNGGKGSDVLKGGVGADTFLFDYYDFEYDLDVDDILDFNVFADQLKVINASSVATLTYDNGTGEVRYDEDGAGSAYEAQVIATMDAGLGLSSAHLVLELEPPVI